MAGTARKRYHLLAADGSIYESDVPGQLGGYRPRRIYGRLDCKSAIRHLPGYAKHRVFFADETAAIAAGYRPCGKCMHDRYQEWKRGGEPGSSEYPWLVNPKAAAVPGRLHRASESPALSQQIEQAERDLTANKGVNWRKVRDDV